MKLSKIFFLSFLLVANQALGNIKSYKIYPFEKSHLPTIDYNPEDILPDESPYKDFSTAKKEHIEEGIINKCFHIFNGPRYFSGTKVEGYCLGSVLIAHRYSSEPLREFAKSNVGKVGRISYQKYGKIIKGSSTYKKRSFLKRLLFSRTNFCMPGTFIFKLRACWTTPAAKILNRIILN